ncbi:CRE-MEC-10 protein [Aphelenchoides avenae]|nr:CRE-MEC-10 protein [Aphelenchus avenae]
MLVVTTAAFVYQSVCMVQDYLMYQKTTNIQLFYEPEAPFPAVTFCNLNPFKRSMVHRSKELSNLVAAYNYVKKVKQAKPLISQQALDKLASRRALDKLLNHPELDKLDSHRALDKLEILQGRPSSRLPR